MIIPQNEVDKAAKEHADYVVQEETPTDWNHEELKMLLSANFKGAIKFAESKFEEILFGNEKESLDDFLLNCEDLSQEDREVAMEAISLYQMFLMEQDEQ